MQIRTILASKGDKKITISNGEMRKVIGPNYFQDEVLVYINGIWPINFKNTRKGSTWYAKDLLPAHYSMPMVGHPVYHNITINKAHSSIVTTKESTFDLIRTWAKERGIYKKGDVKTQFLKLQEETGELAKAILKNDTNEIIDAIGDIVVVLTNLTELTGIKLENTYDKGEFEKLKIEDCIDSAYNVIKNRTGKMTNGTFVKNEK